MSSISSWPQCVKERKLRLNIIVNNNRYPHIVSYYFSLKSNSGLNYTWVNFLGKLGHKSSATMVLVEYDKQVHVFYDEGFQLPVISQCHEMMENTNICSLRKLRMWRVNQFSLRFLQPCNKGIVCNMAIENHTMGNLYKSILLLPNLSV